MSDNIRKMNLVMEKYHTEFVNMLNLSLRPAYPASGVVVMDLIQGKHSRRLCAGRYETDWAGKPGKTPVRFSLRLFRTCMSPIPA